MSLRKRQTTTRPTDVQCTSRRRLRNLSHLNPCSPMTSELNGDSKVTPGQNFQASFWACGCSIQVQPRLLEMSNRASGRLRLQTISARHSVAKALLHLKRCTLQKPAEIHTPAKKASNKPCTHPYKESPGPKFGLLTHSPKHADKTRPDTWSDTKHTSIAAAFQKATSMLTEQ